MSDDLQPQHENCKTCKLYTKATSPFCGAYGQQQDPTKPVDLYIVTGKVYEHEQKMMGDDAGQWVMNTVRQSGLSYIVDSVVRCSSNRPTAAQKKLCSESFLHPRLKQSRPKIIWCVGLDAAQAVLGSSLGLNQLTKAGIILGPYGIPTIVTDHPSNHSSFKEEQFRGQDLRPVYTQAWYHIDYILRKGWKPTTLKNYLCTRDVDQALEWAAEIALETCWFAYDTEFGLQPHVNVSHHTTELLCFGVGYGESVDTIKVRVFDCRDWTATQRFKVLCSLLQNSTLITTFGKIDLMVMWFTSKYNAWSGSTIGIHNLFDTGQIRWHQDQEQFNNGLEEQCVEVYGAERWKFKTDEALAKIKSDRTIPLAEGLEEYDYRHLDRDFCNEYQGWDAYHQARLWLEKYADPANAAHLKPEYNTPAYVRTQAMTPVICWIERCGMIVDLDYLEIYKEAAEQKIAIMGEWLQNHPIVRKLQAMEDPLKPERPDLDKEGNQKLDRHKNPKVIPASMYLPEEFNPASSPQMVNIFRALDIEAKMKSKVTQAPKADKRELIRQAGGSANPEFQRNGQQKFFFGILLWRGMQKQLSSFILPFIKYAVSFQPVEGPAQMRVHTNFKMNKVLGGSESGTDATMEGGVDTNRFSTADPCISNIIKNNVFRRGFPAPPGKLFWEADQASVEPRVLGYNANCQALIDIFELKDKEPDNPDADLYRIGWRNFQREQGKTWYQSGDVTDEERQMAKPLILGSFYESSAIGIHQRENIPYDICSSFLVIFWKQFPELLAYNAEIRRAVFEGEMLTSCAGHRFKYNLRGYYAYDHEKHKHLTLPELQRLLGIDDGPGSDAELIRKAENSMTQAAAKSITDVLLIELHRYLELNGKKQEWLADLDLNNTVHDSGWGYVREGREVELFVLLRKIARDITLLEKWGIHIKTTAPRILFDLEMKAGKHLGAMEKVKLPKANSILNIPGLVI